MVTPPVMATGKTGNRVHMSHLQTFLPLFFIERLTDTRDIRRSVKVQMNLPELEFMFASHKKILSVCFIVRTLSDEELNVWRSSSYLYSDREEGVPISLFVSLFQK